MTTARVPTHRPRRGRHARLAGAIAALLASAAVVWAAQAELSPRVIVLAFDGFDFALTRDLMAQGRMPNFTRVAATGSFGPLATSNPAQSPVAWSTFATGLHAGVHGVFDFVERDPETLEPFMSTTRRAPSARNQLALGGWSVPRWLTDLVGRRRGEPFWKALEDQDIETTIVRMPVNYPPSGLATRELSGLGTPDLLGTYGRFSYFTSSKGPPAVSVNGGTVYHVAVTNDRIVRAWLEGPGEPGRQGPMRVPFTVALDFQNRQAAIVVGRQERTLSVGDWTNWVPVTLTTAAGDTIAAQCRFHLKQVSPEFQLYVSPLNIDPLNPALPISTPETYASELARATGRFYTQGMPEETNALTAGLLTTDGFLRQARDAQAENRRQFRYVLERFTRGLLFYYFGNVDQVSHMLWGARDGRPGLDPKYARTIDDLYVEFDGIVGEALKRLRPQDLLVVMSDHGFATWRRTFGLNNWLRDQGYLTAGERGASGVLVQIDLSKSRVYGLGLTGVYVNLQGRETSGLVAPAARAALLDEVSAKLLAVVDPATGLPAIVKVFRSDELYPDNDHPESSPDLVIGYAKGTRVSGESALGGLSSSVFSDNTSAWTGDHIMDPETVPGILLTSRPLKKRATNLQDLAASVAAELDVVFPTP